MPKPAPAKTRKPARPPASSSAPAPASAAPKAVKPRYWLTYPTRLVTRPVIWELSQKFKIVFNVRQASVTNEIGILCLELEGVRDEIRAAVTWLEKQGVTVEPVEINVIES